MTAYLLCSMMKNVNHDGGRVSQDDRKEIM